jgi:ketosteroid isomerase-like protein
MTSIHTFLIIMLLPVCVCAQRRSELPVTQNVDSLETLIRFFQPQTEAWKDAYNSADGANLSALYTEDAVYCSSHVPALVAEGREKVIANFQRGMLMGGHIDAVQILSVQMSCDLVTLFCKYEATNRGQKVVGRNLLVLKRVNGTWLIAAHMTVV